MTVNEIMGLVEQYADVEVEDYMYGENKSKYIRDKLRTCIEELHKNAERLELLSHQTEAYGFEDNHEGNRWCIAGPFATLSEAIDTTLKEYT